MSESDEEEIINEKIEIADESSDSDGEKIEKTIIPRATQIKSFKRPDTFSNGGPSPKVILEVFLFGR
jgi:hypothetical protein